MEKTENKNKLSQSTTSSETDEYADIIRITKKDLNKSFAVYQPEIFNSNIMHSNYKSAKSSQVTNRNTSVVDFKTDQFGQEEEDIDDELNWQKCDYFSDNELSSSPQKQPSPQPSTSNLNKSNLVKKLKKSKSFTVKKSKKSICNNRLTNNGSSIINNSYYHKSMLLKSKSKSACLLKAAHRHHSSCLCCFLHEKYAEYISISVSNQKLNSNVQSFQNYLFDPDFVNYLKLIDYKKSPSLPLQHVNNKKSCIDNVGLKRVNISQNKQNQNNNKNNNINTSSSFSLSISNISLNDDDHELITEDKHHKIQNKNDQIHSHISNQVVMTEELNEEQEKFLTKGPNSSKKFSKLSSSSISSISSMSNSSYSSSFTSYSPGDPGVNGLCRKGQIESMCNDLLELNMKLNSNEAEKFENQEKNQQAKELSETQNIFFRQILQLIDTFINLNKYLIFKLNNSFSFENFSVDNLFRFKKLDQFIKASKPLTVIFLLF